MNRQFISRLLLALTIVALLGSAAAPRVDVARADDPPPPTVESPTGPDVPDGTLARLTFQGRLTDKTGVPVTSQVSVVFKLYNDFGAVLWTSAPHSITPVNGLFSVYLGGGSDPSLTTDILSVAASIGVTVGGDAEMTPRQPLNTIVGHHSSNGAGVVGSGSPGVRGYSSWANGIGVFGEANNGTIAYGVYGNSNSGTGVYGSSISGTAVYAASTSGTGVYGSSSSRYGVRGVSTSSIGVYGSSTSNLGVWGISNSGAGVRGESSTSDGLYGGSVSGNGVYGFSTNGNAIKGISLNTGTFCCPAAIYGESTSAAQGIGVWGIAKHTTGYNYGVAGQTDSPNGKGVQGYATAGGIGVYGLSNFGEGVYGLSTYGKGVYGYGGSYGVYGYSGNGGVYGVSDNGLGVKGNSNGSIGVVGESASSIGVLGYSVSDTGVYGHTDNSNSGYAGYFSGGRVHVSGDFSVSGTKAFVIDHPLDPANQYLYHFAVESPEVKNVYDGVVTLDAAGEAVVELPAWFGAVNIGPYRYQLTAIGTPGPNLYIAAKIEANHFKLAGGAPGQEVSWQVVGLRNDPYLRDHPAAAEATKPERERGKYLYPQGYGQPVSLELDYEMRQQLEELAEEAPALK